ncbi:MAG: YHS domain-containing (seleno)protein [Hyphomicrobiaceae bacterium]|nr:YHS domain-containing (seleno)protein [Hyphomicrobiaceae bacterium]
MISRRGFFSLAGGVSLAGALGLSVSSEALAQKTAPVFTGIVKGVAVGGYDPVAYFTESKPVKGNPAISLDHEGAKWYFATEANRETFKKEPAKYAPQYGGYCAWAVSQGYTAKGDPEAWTVHNGKLYLNYNKSVHADWSKNIPGHVAKGDANWPKVLAK